MGKPRNPGPKKSEGVLRMRGTDARNPYLLIVGRARKGSTYASKTSAFVAPSTVIAASILASDMLATSVAFRRDIGPCSL